VRVELVEMPLFVLIRSRIAAKTFALGHVVGSAPKFAGRLLFIDNIRWTMVILVLTMHATDTYSPFGNWYYTDRTDSGLGTIVFFAIYQSFLQAFFMGLLFFVSGYFTVQAWERKDAVSFIRGRFVRLGIPTLLYMLVIGPFTQYFLSHTWGTGGFGQQWLIHLRDGEWLSESGPMWFCATLLMFSLIFVAIPKARLQPQSPQIALPTGKAVIAFILGMALSTFLVRILIPENKSLLNVHLGDFPQYILMFSAGIVAHRGAWLLRTSERTAIRGSAAALVLSMLLLGFLIGARGSAQVDRQASNGGFNFVSGIKCLWEALVCFGMSIGLLAVYKRTFNHQSTPTRFLSDNAFAVYLFHPPVLIAIAIALHGLSAPALAKDLLLSLGACIVTFLASALVFRRMPLLRRIL
jgi:glucan biosynthesis protein C